MSLRPRLSGLALASLACALAAQVDAPRGPGRERVELQRHDEETSRTLFGACDADGDDRLDLFEACDAFEALGDPRDVRPFARLDVDRDGFLSWPEFDSHLRFAIDRAGSVRVRPSRAFTPPTAPDGAAATPAQRLLRLYDANRDGGLDPDEVDRFVAQIGLPPAFVASLRSLDADRSGKIEEAELAPWMQLIQPFLPEADFANERPASPLPPPWGLGDRDGNGRLDPRELTNLLRRLDPSLVRWSTTWFARLDKNRDGWLDAGELDEAPKARTTAQLR